MIESFLIAIGFFIAFYVIVGILGSGGGGEPQYKPTAQPQCTPSRNHLTGYQRRQIYQEYLSQGNRWRSLEEYMKHRSKELSHVKPGKRVL